MWLGLARCMQCSDDWLPALQVGTGPMHAKAAAEPGSQDPFLRGLARAMRARVCCSLSVCTRRAEKGQPKIFYDEMVWMETPSKQGAATCSDPSPQARGYTGTSLAPGNKNQ